MKLRIMLLTMLLVIFLSACQSPSESSPVVVEPEVAPVVEESTLVLPIEEPEPLSETSDKPPEKWQYGGLAIGGNYADSDFVDIGNGKYRMYYAIEPEVPGNKLEVYSATSSDGMKWEPEEGVRRTFTVFPDVVKLPDGTWRMYFQNAGVIKSAKSSDGLKWTDESG